MDPSQLSYAFSFDDASNDINSPFSSNFSQPVIESEKVKVIWGTTINVQRSIEQFKSFLRGSSKYTDKINDCISAQIDKMELDCKDLPAELANQLEFYPQETISIFENALFEVINELTPESQLIIKLRFVNIGKEITIRNVDPKDIDRIVRVKGLTTRVSPVMPEIQKGFYKCSNCANELLIEQIKGIITEPSSCDCGVKLAYQLLINKSVYTDKQVIKLQELPENILDGSTPLPITVLAEGNLVDIIIPGDKIEAIGILRAVPVKVNHHNKKIKSNFRVFLELLSAQKIGKSFPLEQPKEISIEKIQELRQNQNCYEILAAMIAPSVYGMADVKKALLLQLFGGVRKEINNMTLRGDINILLAGDPGISKSQLLSFIHRIIPRGIFTSGRGSSAVGLSASVKKDVDTSAFVLEPGALVLSDNGICCIDEFDKMTDLTKSVLHEVMEQQTVTVAKAGIITTLNARCSILASCNPIESKYNIKKSIIENLNLVPTLLSRFDIVCLLIDKVDEENDRVVSNHILDLYSTEAEDDIDLLKAYVEEARKIDPRLTEQANEELKIAYCNLRQLDNGKTITATTRQLESLIRISEAHARMRISNLVEVQDVKEAIRLVKESLLMYAVDPLTGKIDMDLVITGKSSYKKKLMELLKNEIIGHLKKPCSVDDLVVKTNSDEKMMLEVLQSMVNEEIVFFDVKNRMVEKI